MRKKKNIDNLKMLSLLLLLVALFFLSFFVGRFSLSPLSVIRILGDKIISILSFGKFSLNRSWSGSESAVVLNIRLPRILAAILIGASLSLSGAVFQGMFRNPMVSPDLLGASTGSGFGAALMILLGGGYFAITLSSFLFGLLAVFLAFLVSRKSKVNTQLALVLAGVMISSLFSSGTSFIKLVSDTENQLPSITYWLMGSLTSIKGRDVLFASIPILVGIVTVFLLRWRVNLLTLSDEEAESLGVNVKALRIVLIIAATLMTSSSVSISGLIGWVGLVIPHFSRLIFGNDYQKIIPSSILLGSSFLLFVDNISRIITTSEIPLGILTSFIGTPFFIYLIVTGGKK